MHEVSEEDTNAIVRPMALFTQPDKIESTELADADATPPQNYQDNGAFPPIDTQSSLLHSPLTDTLINLEKNPPHPHVGTRAAAVLASTVDLPEIRL